MEEFRNSNKQEGFRESNNLLTKSEFKQRQSVSFISNIMGEKSVYVETAQVPSIKTQEINKKKEEISYIIRVDDIQVNRQTTTEKLKNKDDKNIENLQDVMILNFDDEPLS